MSWYHTIILIHNIDRALWICAAHSPLLPENGFIFNTITKLTINYRNSKWTTRLASMAHVTLSTCHCTCLCAFECMYRFYVYGMSQRLGSLCQQMGTKMNGTIHFHVHIVVAFDPSFTRIYNWNMFIWYVTHIWFKPNRISARFSLRFSTSNWYIHDEIGIYK